MPVTVEDEKLDKHHNDSSQDAQPSHSPSPKKEDTQLATVNPVVDDQALVADPEPALEYVPDGGREAWTVVLGSSLALFASAGMINAYVSHLPDRSTPL